VIVVFSTQLGAMAGRERFPPASIDMIADPPPAVIPLEAGPVKAAAANDRATASSGEIHDGAYRAVQPSAVRSADRAGMLLRPRI